MPRPAIRQFSYLLLAASISTFLLVILGYVVRVTNSNLGCPDWPTCYGQFGLPSGAAAQIQYLHRITTAIAAVLIFSSTLIAAVRFRKNDPVVYSLVGAGLLFVIEMFSGRNATGASANETANLLHLGLALIILALLVYATMRSLYVKDGNELSHYHLSFNNSFKKMVGITWFGMLALMGDGVFLIANSNQVCSGWPFCSGLAIPTNIQGWIPLLHGALAGLVMVLVSMTFFGAWRRFRNNEVILTAATATAALFLGQVFIGALKVSRGFPPELIGVHAMTTVALWVAITVLTISVGLDRGGYTNAEGSPNPPDPNFSQRLRDFFMLTKPLIVVLLLITTVAGMIIGGKAIPSFSLFAWTVIAGGFAAGGASAINQYIDRDLDKKMQRTAKRPVASGRMRPAEGLAFGVGLCFLSFFLFAGLVNLLAALLSLAGMVYYVLIYSIFLKKVTIQNIVIGGGAGAIPPLVGWAAATHGLNVPSLLLFAIVFFWTPPHFWALAMVRVKDYARAGIPMLPVVKGEQKTRLQIFIYTLELVGLTLLLPLFNLVGSLYLVSAAALGGVLIYYALKVLLIGGNKTAWSMYRYSSIYLALLFFAMVLDVLLRKPG